MKTNMADNVKKCCNNCDNLIKIPRKNRFGDADYLCIISTYFVSGRDKDIEKVERYTPGGKKLPCQWVEK